MMIIYLQERRTGNILRLERKVLTASQLKEMQRDGFKVIDICYTAK